MKKILSLLKQEMLKTGQAIVHPDGTIVLGHSKHGETIQARPATPATGGYGTLTHENAGIAARLAKPRMEWDSTAGNWVILGEGGSRVPLTTIPGTEPVIGHNGIVAPAQADTSALLAFSKEAFGDLTAAADFAAADDNRYVYEAVRFYTASQPPHPDNIVTVEATDGRVACRVSVAAATLVSSAEVDALIPSGALLRILAKAGGSVGVTIVNPRDYVLSTECEGYMLSIAGQQLEGTFPKIDSVIPTDAVFMPTFLKALSDAKLHTTFGVTTYVKFGVVPPETPSPYVVSQVMDSAQLLRVEAGELPSDTVMFSCAAKYLKRVSAAFADFTEIEIGFRPGTPQEGGPNPPLPDRVYNNVICFRSKDSRWLALLMPVKLNSEVSI